MDVDPHAPLDPTPSSSNAPATPPPGQVFNNSDFYSAHFEAHVASVVAHFRGDTGDLFKSSRGPPNSSTDPFRWSETDKDLFFAALRRRGKSFPELIAADMHGRKSLMEVTAYLTRLDSALGALSDARRAELRIAPPPAREVSERWLAFEEDLADEYLVACRKRELELEDEDRMRKRQAEMKRVPRTLPPPPWVAPGAGPMTYKSQVRRRKQIARARKNLEKRFVREDWLEPLDGQKMRALNKELKRPTLKGVWQEDLVSTGTAEPPQMDLEPPDPAVTPPSVPTAPLEGEPQDGASPDAHTVLQQQQHRLKGRLRKEVAVLGLYDFFRDKGTDVLSMLSAHRILSRTPPGQDPLQISPAVLDTAIVLLRAHITRIIQHVVAAQPAEVGNESESDHLTTVDSNDPSAAGARLITGRHVHTALGRLYGVNGPAGLWKDEEENGPQLNPPAPDLDRSDPPFASQNDSAPESDDEPPPITSIERAAASPVIRENGITPMEALFAPLPVTSLYRFPPTTGPEGAPLPVGVTLLPPEDRPLAPATYFKGIDSPAEVDLSDDDDVLAEQQLELDAASDARLDEQDLAADHAWEDGLWATVGNMDPNGLAWLTLSNLIDIDNADLDVVHVFSSEEEDQDDDEMRTEMEVDEGSSVAHSSRASQTPPRPVAKRDRVEDA